MMLPNPPHSMGITIRVDDIMLIELLAEAADIGISKILNRNVKHTLRTLIEEAHKDKYDKNAI